jgi:hypothetical protein
VIEKAQLRSHIEGFFGARRVTYARVSEAPVTRRLPDFEVAEVRGGWWGKPWVYVSLGASAVSLPWTGAPNGHEFVIVAARADARHIEHLAMVANFHADPAYEKLGLGRLIEIGRPWVEGSMCRAFMVSLPYYQGPKFEILHALEGHVRFLWLTPITPTEAEFARQHGPEALEQRLESAEAPVAQAFRPSVV